MLKTNLVRLSLAAIFLLFFSLRFVDVTIGEKLYEYPLETAWKATGLALTEVSTETWMKLNDRWLTVTELKTVAEQIKGKLNISEKTRMTTGQQGEFNFVCFEGTRGDGTQVTITLQSADTDATRETQLGINTIYNGPVNNLRRYIEVLKGYIITLGSNAHFSVVLEGKRRGKITPLLIRELSGRAFQKVAAVAVESSYQNGCSSDKGYTKLIQDEITYNFKKVNIEFSTRYDETEDLTQVLIATPNLTDGV